LLHVIVSSTAPLNDAGVPNKSHIMHEDDAPGTTTQTQRMQAGDAWAASYLPKVFASPQYQAGRTVVHRDIRRGKLEADRRNVHRCLAVHPGGLHDERSDGPLSVTRAS
jgi:hypothetical protein